MASAQTERSARRPFATATIQLLVGLAGTLFASAAAAQFYVPVSGIFTDTDADCGSGGVVCSGVDSSSVSWGKPVAGTVLQSSLSFTPNPMLDPNDILPGRVITLGQLKFINGTAEPGSWIDNTTLEISTGGYTPPLSFVINTINTLCVGGEPAEVCADYIHFRDSEVFGSFRVWEGYYGTVEVKGLVGSLSLAGFGKIVGVGFADAATGQLGLPLDPSLLPPDLQVGFLSPSIQPIPEPATVMQLLFGLGLLAAVYRRQRRASQPGAASCSTVA